MLVEQGMLRNENQKGDIANLIVKKSFEEKRMEMREKKVASREIDLT